LIHFNQSDTASTIAALLPIDSAATKTLAANAVSQMGERRGGKHTLIHMGQVRKVMVSLLFFNLLNDQDNNRQ